ncbi:G/U mismatch-specific DNA glycosylase [bacterium]|nr:G/U mismatch-specific DNA glycosylase [bacterium]
MRPSSEEILKAVDKTLRDVIAPNLRILFCGINPGLYSAAVGHNFARPGNRFWPALFGANFTDRLLAPAEEKMLLQYDCGITNIVKRATASAEELHKKELIAGAKEVVRKVLHYKPDYLAVVGVTAYRVAFAAPKAKLGLQKDNIGKTFVWVLPNPSGMNAHYQLPDLIRCFKELRAYAFVK